MYSASKHVGHANVVPSANTQPTKEYPALAVAMTVALPGRREPRDPVIVPAPSGITCDETV